MTTLLISHPASLNHSNGPGHPERPDRLRAIESVLEQEKFQPLIRVEPEAAPLEAIALCHPMNYIQAIKQASPKEGLVQLDADTSMSPGSFEAALRAVGGAIRAVDEVVTKKAANAFVCHRPPGHHAETVRPMGFCIFSNVAIAALYARKTYGLERVAVVDFDVHHGNGTQDIFWSDKNLYFASTHQMPLYPGTGALSETGVGNVWNAPLRPGDGGDPFKEAFRSRILPSLRSFGPDLVLISAGFDAHQDDPLANLRLLEPDFAWATSQIAEIADKHAQGRLVSMLEGGYNLAALAKSVGVHVRALMNAGA